MKASQYKAIREAGVAEFAIYPADVEYDLPYTIKHANTQQSVRACPTGLLRATVIEDDVEWSEAFTLGCGDTEYQRKRRNGVLVEVSFDDFHAWRKGTVKALVQAINEHPRMRALRHDDSRFVEMIVAKAAIMAPWNEYALIAAEREKEKVEQAERKARLDAVVEAVGARHGQFTQLSERWDEQKKELVPPPREEYDYAALREWGSRANVAYLRGDVVLSLERAEEVVALLNKSGGKKK